MQTFTSAQLTSTQLTSCLNVSSGVAKGGGPRPPILQTKHKHTYKLHKICQFGQFIFGKIIKIVATRSHLIKLKCTKFDFSWGSPRPRWGSSQRSPDLLLILGSPISNGREAGEKGRAGEERGVKERLAGKKGQKGKGKGRGKRRGPQLQFLASMSLLKNVVKP